MGKKQRKVFDARKFKEDRMLAIYCTTFDEFKRVIRVMECEELTNEPESSLKKHFKEFKRCVRYDKNDCWIVAHQSHFTKQGYDVVPAVIFLEQVRKNAEMRTKK